MKMLMKMINKFKELRLLLIFFLLSWVYMNMMLKMMKIKKKNGERDD